MTFPVRAPRVFAVVPAAGESRRMGRPKLLLPLGGRTVLARLLDALRPVVDAVAVVVRPNDEPLAKEAADGGAMVVRPEVPPPDMRQSVEHGLRALRDGFAPMPEDAWLLVPADHPVLDRAAVDAVIARWRSESPLIVTPTHAGRRGHPTLFSWRLADGVFALPANAGLNQLLRTRQSDVAECPVESPGIHVDLDTPADYEALRQRFERELP